MKLQLLYYNLLQYYYYYYYGIIFLSPSFPLLLRYSNVTAVAYKRGARVKVVLNKVQLDGSLPANPVNDRRVANAVTLKSTFRLP